MPKKTKSRRHEDHARALKDALLLEIGLVMEAKGIPDTAAEETMGERVEVLRNALKGNRASYGIVRLMRALSRLGVPVSLSVTPASTMLRAGEHRTVIRYREPTEGGRRES
jgi:hypothetical protein